MLLHRKFLVPKLNMFRGKIYLYRLIYVNSTKARKTRSKAIRRILPSQDYPIELVKIIIEENKKNEANTSHKFQN